MDDAQLDEIKAIFRHFDKDNNGHIEAGELLALLKAMGDEPSADDLAMAIEALDSDRNGRIEFDEFVTWWGTDR